MKLKRKVKFTIPESLPDPSGYHLLVVIPKIEEASAGGVLLPHVSRDKEEHASVVAYVAKMGPDAYLDPGKFPSGPWCSVGDYVLIKKYDGNRLSLDDVEFRILNDDTILGKVADPQAVERLF